MQTGFFDSSEEAFHRLAPQMWGNYLGKKLGCLGNYPDFLVLIHKDMTADAYVGAIPVTMKFRTKGRFQEKQSFQNIILQT